MKDVEQKGPSKGVPKQQNRNRRKEKKGKGRSKGDSKKEKGKGGRERKRERGKGGKGRKGGRGTEGKEEQGKGRERKGGKGGKKATKAERKGQGDQGAGPPRGGEESEDGVELSTCSQLQNLLQQAQGHVYTHTVAKSRLQENMHASSVLQVTDQTREVHQRQPGIVLRYLAVTFAAAFLETASGSPLSQCVHFDIGCDGLRIIERS